MPVVVNVVSEEEYDAWLSEREVTDQDQEAAYVAVGIYYVEHCEQE